METNGKLSTKFVERFLNGSPFSSQDLNYEKPEVIKKTINSTYNIKNQLNGVCPMKNIENGYHNVNNHNGHTNGLTNGHANGLTNGHTNGLTNGHTNGLTNGHTNGHINSESEDKENQTEKKPLQYGDYLQLEKLLSCQLPRTRILRDKEIHDEHLFIITHQIYELWFLQILVELNSTRELITEKIELKNDSIFTGENVSKIRSRLNRMLVIFKLLISQWDVLNTMTAPDFVEFRAYLKPASGFQSLQFRLIENKLGVRTDSRANYGKCNYLKVFSQDNNKINTLKNSENDPSLHDLIERWLEKQSTDEFIKKYRKAANRELKDLEALINESKIVNSDLTEDYLKDLTKKQQLIEHWTNEDRYNELVKRGDRRLSFKAFKTLLCIHVHKDDFKFSMMFQILEILQEIDEALSSWRGKHVSIVKKMIGTDLNGTGGSSGYQYLKSTTTDRYKIFNDIGSIGSYLISHQFMKDYD